MIYLFFGEDAYRKKEKVKELINGFSQENRSFLFSRVDAENFKKDEFEELIRSADLFGANRIIVCENVFDDKNSAEFIMENVSLCGQSQNIFIFSENNLEPGIANTFKKHGAKTEEFPCLSSWETKKWLKSKAKERGIDLEENIEKNLIEESGKNLWLLSSNLEKYSLNKKRDEPLKNRGEEISVFKITDAVSEKNKGRAWLLFQKSLLMGADAEEIFWKILWQIKNLLIIKGLGYLQEKQIVQKTKLHHYVVKKTLSASRNFNEEELSRYSKELIDLYHDSRRGLGDFETGIEKFLIKL